MSGADAGQANCLRFDDHRGRAFGLIIASGFTAEHKDIGVVDGRERFIRWQCSYGACWNDKPRKINLGYELRIADRALAGVGNCIRKELSRQNGSKNHNSVGR